MFIYSIHEIQFFFAFATYFSFYLCFYFTCILHFDFNLRVLLILAATIGYLVESLLVLLLLVILLLINEYEFEVVFKEYEYECHDSPELFLEYIWISLLSSTMTGLSLVYKVTHKRYYFEK